MAAMTTAIFLWSVLLLAQPGPIDAAQVAALRAELASLVTATGAAKAGRIDRLDALATRGGRTAETARDAAVQLAARLVQARAYHAIALEEIARARASLASLRLVQMRSAANAARRLDTPGAAVVGDYWLLMADLLDARRNARDTAEAQIAAIAQMERFLSIHGDDGGDDAPVVPPIVRAVKLALMRVCDQAGENERAMQLLGELRDGASLAEAAAFAPVAANAALVGRPLAPALRQRVPGAWRLLVMHDPAQAEAMRDAAARMQHTFSAGEVTLTVAPVPAVRDELGASLPQGLGDGLPRFVLVDPRGVIRAVGHGEAVAQRLPAFLPDPAGHDAGEPVE